MVRRLCLMCIALMMSGCSLWSDDLVEPKLVVDIKAATNINPNVEGKPSPVELRIYQLTNNNAFELSDFIKFIMMTKCIEAELAVSRQLQAFCR
ncbi:hypothetical protein VSWAT3_04171 [Vibrionales bacterium SWAT-3]|nr:hypothetical protein VSWAT3_04171 [Vibrionales bacterium SWAT-3]